MKFIHLLYNPRLLLVLIFSFVIYGGYAQLTESFESSSAPPNNWKMVYEDPTPSLGLYNNEMMHVDPSTSLIPYSNPSYDTAYSGSQVFRFSSYDTDSDKKYFQYLISPPINGNSGNDSIAFYYRINQSYGDKFRVGWSTTTNDTSAFTFGPDVTVQKEDTLWTLFSKNDLPENTKYICIKYGRDNTSGYMLFVDGFYGPPSSNLDAAVLDFNEPIYPGSKNIEIDFANTGMTDLTSLNFDYEIDGVAQSQVSWSGLMKQDSVNTNYKLGTYNFSSGSHTIKIWSSSPNGSTDEDHGNDTIVRNFITANDPYVDAGNDADICAGENYTINNATATGYDSLVWTTSGSGSFLNPNSIFTTYLPSAGDTAFGLVTLTLTAYGYPGHPDASDQKTITIHGTPAVSFSGLQASYCRNDNNDTLSGSPSSGAFSGTGIVNGNEFSPLVAGSGNFTITYSYTDSYGCSNSYKQTVTVNSLPIVNLNGLESQYCKENINDTLTGLPYGGSFSGQGMTDSIFNPGGLVGGNNYNITYSYTDANGCTGAITQSTLVRSLPSLSFSGLNSNYCDSDSASTLVPNPAGGTFSGPGVSGASFDPVVAGTGTHTISYSYTDTNGCSNTINQSTTVNSAPTVSFSGLAANYCDNDSAVTLNGSPAGGTFLGPGINGNQFSPSAAGAGSHVIKYSYTSSAGCSGEQTKVVTVNPVPNASFSGLKSTYCEDEPVDTLMPAVSGGFFIGKGVNKDSLFNPQAAGPGIYKITYWNYGQSGCFDSTTQKVVVNPKPVADIVGLASSYCENDPDVTLSGVPSGGSFSGPGINGNKFLPQSAGGGDHQITYDVTNSYGCSDTKKRSVHVDTLPSVSFSGLDAKYCADAQPDTLSGLPEVSGGVFLGKGMQDSIFHPNIAQAGTWEIIYHVTTSAGCVNADTQFVNVKPLPNIDLGQDKTVCINDSTMLTDLNQSADSYLWSTGSTKDSIYVLADQDTSFSVTGTLNGCTNSDKISIGISDPVVDLGPDTVLCADQSITLDAGPGYKAYIWSNGATIHKITLDSTGIGLDSIDVSVLVQDAAGCVGKDTINVDFEICNGIADYKENKYRIYPNPGDGLLTIEGEFRENDRINIYDNHGRFMNSFEIGNNKKRVRIDLRNLEQGIYFLLMQKEKVTISRKIIITK